MMTYLFGLIIGLTLGLTGAGGSVFAVPLLIYGLGMSPQAAIGISLGAVSLCALYGTLMRLRSGHILWLPALVFAGVGSLFAPLGNHLNQHLSPTLLMLSFAILVLIIGVRLWLMASKQPQHSKVVRGQTNSTLSTPTLPLCALNHDKPFTIGPKCLSGMVVAAISTGILSGLFGVGGGFLIVPALLYLIRITMIEAVATSLFVITLVSGSGFAAFLMNNDITHTDVMIKIVIGGGIGMTLGLLLSNKLAGPKLQKVFAILMWLTAIFVMLKTI